MNKIVTAATDGFNRLQDMLDDIKLVEQALVHAPDSVKTEVKKWGKALKEKIAEVELLYMEPEDVKGIKRNPENLTSSLGAVGRYINDINGEPSQMVGFTMEKARTHTASVLEEVNRLVNEDFVEYREKVQALTINLFHNLEPVDMK